MMTSGVRGSLLGARPMRTPVAPQARARPQQVIKVISSSRNRRLQISPVRPASNSRSRVVGLVVRANLFNRLFRVVKAWADGLVGSFEAPEKLLDRLMDEMQSDVTRMRQANAQAIASQRQIDARASNMQANADQWLRRAELAVKSGQDDLAREALRRRKALQDDTDRLASQAQTQQKAVDQLGASARLLESKIGEARAKKETLKARAITAKTNIQLQEMIGSLRSTSDSAFGVFDKMEEKVMALETEAESISALAAPDTLEQRFAMLEGGTGVEDELKALKASQGGALLEPRRVKDVLQPSNGGDVEYELEELRRRARY